MCYQHPTGCARAVLAAMVSLWIASSAVGQNPFGISRRFQLSSNVKLDEAEPAARRNLVQIQAHLANDQWDDAVEGLRRVMDSQGDRVIAVPGYKQAVEDAKKAKAAAEAAARKATAASKAAIDRAKRARQAAERNKNNKALADARAAADKAAEAADQAKKKAKENKAKAVDALSYLMRFRRSVSLRDHCHMRIARLPDEALRLYRQRVDLPKFEVRRAIVARDRRVLESIVRDSFCSTWGDEALFALGELALERGHYTAARAHWERIISPADWSKICKFYDEMDVEKVPPSQRSVFYFLADRIAAHQPVPSRPADSEYVGGGLLIRWLRYPDTNLDRAEVLAQLVLVSIREGAVVRAGFELSALRALHPNAKGRIGGRDVGFAEWLTDELETARRKPAPRKSRDWRTFAGSNRRSRAVGDTIRLSGPPAVLRLPNRLKAGAFAEGVVPQRVAEDPDGLLSYHPLIVGDLVLVNSQEKIFAIDTRTGRPPKWAADDGRIYPPPSVKDVDIPRFSADTSEALGTPRFTMTAHGSLLFARMGPPQTSRPDRQHSSYFRPGYLLCLDLAAEGRLVWSMKPESSKWAFEGSPVTDGTHIYVAMRQSGVRPQAHVACFDIASGRRLWRQKVCSADTPARDGQEITHNLLTLHEETIYYNTNLGAIAALSTTDGQVKWANIYPRAKVNLNQPPTHFYRDLTPCVFYRSVLIVAPSDHSGLFGLDAATGQLIWDSLLSDPVHLLGTADGKLVASGKGIFLLDAMNGYFERFWPSRNHPDPPGFGRGLIAGNLVYRPTREEIEVLDLGSLTPAARQPISLVGKASGGNLVAAGDLVVIATTEKLYIFGGAAPLAPKDGAERKKSK
ncbi:MAG: PQQ-binding-like beta-propeller repeat protein [Planctomycetes bacterium]|nr:PQQ-binding-like beta-propeller repeat protein [Planctomycetota bacterium]